MGSRAAPSAMPAGSGLPSPCAAAMTMSASISGISDGATMALCATGISQSSSTACSFITRIFFFAAWRNRCASNG